LRFPPDPDKCAASKGRQAGRGGAFCISAGHDPAAHLAAAESDRGELDQGNHARHRKRPCTAPETRLHNQEGAAMSKKHVATPDPDKQPLLFSDIGGDTPEQFKKHLLDFLAWYPGENPKWRENAFWEIMESAIECFREFISKEAAPVHGPFSVTFPFAVKVNWPFLNVEPPPIPGEIPAAELQAFRERLRAISEREISRILQEKTAEAAGKGDPAPEIDQARRERIQAAIEEAHNKIIAAHKEKRRRAAIYTLRHAKQISDEEIALMEEAWQAEHPGEESPELTPEQEAELQLAEVESVNTELHDWFSSWRWAVVLQEMWMDSRDKGEGREPEPETLTLWHWPDPKRKKSASLWGEPEKTEATAFRLETLQEIAERQGMDFELPGKDSPEAFEGKRLFERLCPEGMLDRKNAAFTISETIGPEEKKVAFKITIELHPLTFDLRSADPETEPETFFPFCVLCETGEGGAAWEELTPGEKTEIFRRMLAEVREKITPENWNFPGWDAVAPAPGNKKRTPIKKMKLPRAQRRSQATQDLFAFIVDNAFFVESADKAAHLTAGHKDLALVKPETLTEFVDKTGEIPQWIGFNFRDLRLDALKAISLVFARLKNPKDGRLIVTTEEYLHATGLEKILCADGKKRFPPDQAKARLDALTAVAMTTGIIRCEENGTEPGTKRIKEFCGSILSIVRVWDDLSAREALEVHAGSSSIDLSKMKMLEIQVFTPLWEIRSDKKNPSRFIYTPTNYKQRLRDAEIKAGVGSKPSKARELFLVWLSDQGSKHRFLVERGRKKNHRLEIPIQELAAKLHLHKEIESGRRGRIINEIRKAAKVAFFMGYIGPHGECWDAKRGVFCFDLKEGPLWKEIEAFQKSRREELPTKQAAQFFPDIEAMYQSGMGALDRMITEYQKDGHTSQRKEIAVLEKEWTAEYGRAANDSSLNAEERRQKLEAIGKIMNRARVATGLPAKRKKKTVKAASPITSDPAPDESRPSPDPGAAEVWPTIRDELCAAFPNWSAEIMAAVPVNLTETGGRRSIDLWQRPGARPWGFISIDPAKGILERHQASISLN
jgi:hypothetical protein